MDHDTNSLVAILDRVEAGRASAEDRVRLRNALLVNGEGNVVQLGKHNVRMDHGENIQIGDRIYQGVSAEAIRKANKDVLRESDATEVVDLAAAEGRYREDVVRVYNQLGFSGFPEVDITLLTAHRFSG